MKAALKVLVFAALACLLIGGVLAAEEKTLKGKITCAKCDLNKEKACTTVIVVKEGDKDVTYYLDEKSGKANHKTICKEGKNGSVKGEVSEKDGKKIITAAKDGVKFD